MTVGKITPATLAGSLTATKQMARDFPEGIRKSLIVLIESMSNEQIAKADRIEITADIEAD